MRTIPAGEFKAKCLKIMDEVAATGVPVVVTKRGKPVVRLEPSGQAAPAGSILARRGGWRRLWRVRTWFRRSLAMKSGTGCWMKA